MPTVGRLSILENTLSALRIAVQGYDAQLILVDDSKDGRVLPQEGFTVLRSGGKGAAHARNTGLAAASSGLLIFIDDDISIKREHIERTLELHASSPKKAFNFCWIYPDSLMARLPGSKFGRYILEEGLYSSNHRLRGAQAEADGMVEETGGLTSQYFSIERRWMEEVGGYDDIPFAGVEDLLLFKKLQAIGVKVILSKTDIVLQDESNRLSVDALFRRYRTGALTRRIAYKRGEKDVGVEFSDSQMIKGRIGAMFLTVLRVMLRVLPYGFLYKKTVRYILFTGTYLGFYRDELPPGYSA